MNYCWLVSVAYSSSDNRSEVGLNSASEPKSGMKPNVSFAFASIIS